MRIPVNAKVKWVGHEEDRAEMGTVLLERQDNGLGQLVCLVEFEGQGRRYVEERELREIK
jgi:hypothetical protein